MGFVPIFLILYMNLVIHIRILLWIFLYPYLPPHSSGKMQASSSFLISSIMLLASFSISCWLLPLIRDWYCIPFCIQHHTRSSNPCISIHFLLLSPLFLLLHPFLFDEIMECLYILHLTFHVSIECRLSSYLYTSLGLYQLLW